jgi:hypothetical protein
MKRKHALYEEIFFSLNFIFSLSCCFITTYQIIIIFLFSVLFSLFTFIFIFHLCFSHIPYTKKIDTKCRINLRKSTPMTATQIIIIHNKECVLSLSLLLTAYIIIFREKICVPHSVKKTKGAT